MGGTKFATMRYKGGGWVVVKMDEFACYVITEWPLKLRNAHTNPYQRAHEYKSLKQEVNSRNM